MKFSQLHFASFFRFMAANLFLLEFFLVCAGIQYSVIQCLIKNMFKYLDGQLF